MALEPTLARKTKLRPKRKGKGPPPARSTIGSAIAEVLHEHGALPASEIAEQIKAGGREIESRSVSFALQALKKQGRVRIRAGNGICERHARGPRPLNDAIRDPEIDPIDCDFPLVPESVPERTSRQSR